jgi:hypothetical protein
MVHVDLRSVETYNKKFGCQNLKNKNMLCRVPKKAFDKEVFAEYQQVGTRQRILFAEYQPSALDKG